MFLLNTTNGFICFQYRLINYYEGYRRIYLSICSPPEVLQIRPMLLYFLGVRRKYTFIVILYSIMFYSNVTVIIICVTLTSWEKLVLFSIIFTML